MEGPRHEVADVVRLHGQSFAQKYPRLLTTEHQRILNDILVCRTAPLGGHVYKCEKCHSEKNVYNSCLNRHCPKCGAIKRFEWTKKQTANVLPVPYFHVVFTLPHEIAPIALQNKRKVYGMLFEAASQTLLTLGKDPKRLGAKIGFIGVLHTWGQQLEHHPHIHCVVPGGGLKDDKWKACKQDFLFPVAVMRELFRGKFLAMLRKAHDAGELVLEGKLATLKVKSHWKRFLRPLYKQKWVVYAKPPFGGPEQVLKYLARYTHRVAFANTRLVKMDETGVLFRYKDYRDGNTKLLKLDGPEFLRRFLLHSLPKGLMRIRQFGFLSNRTRKKSVQLARWSLEAEPVLPASATTTSAHPDKQTTEKKQCCSQCDGGEMLMVRELPADFTFRRVASAERWNTS